MIGSLAVIVIIALFMSLRLFLSSKDKNRPFLSFESLMLLLNVYLTVLLGFGLMYMLFELQGNTVLLEQGEVIQGGLKEHLGASMYFSAITLFSVGYGDITPVGFGRWIASMEALIGYTLPAAFVVRTVFYNVRVYQDERDYDN